jgi:hypothetical protein
MFELLWISNSGPTLQRTRILLREIKLRQLEILKTKTDQHLMWKQRKGPDTINSPQFHIDGTIILRFYWCCDRS